MSKSLSSSALCSRSGWSLSPPTIILRAGQAGVQTSLARSMLPLGSVTSSPCCNWCHSGPRGTPRSSSLVSLMWVGGISVIWYAKQGTRCDISTALTSMAPSL